MVHTVGIVDQTEAIPLLFKRVIDGYIDVAHEDEHDFERILRHATDHIRDAYTMLKTLHSFSGDPTEDTRRDMRVLSEELDTAMNALARFAILREFEAV